MKPKFILIISVLLIYASLLDAQVKKEVTGIVTSFKSIPLNKVRITALKSGITVYTDQTGQFNISCNEKDILEFSAAGFKGKKIRLTKENIYQINLAFNYKPTSFDDATGNGHIGIETLQKAIDNENLRKIKDYSRYS